MAADPLTPHASTPGKRRSKKQPVRELPGAPPKAKSERIAGDEVPPDHRVLCRVS